MFDDQLEAVRGDRRALADLAADAEEQSRILGCRKLVIAAAWADAHSEVDHPEGGVLVERLVRIGPAGTPEVAEFAAAGLVSPFDCSIQSARSWMADALTIRHRLPKLWQRVVAGEVHHWKAREIAGLTSDVSVALVGQVDEQTVGWVEQLPWATFQRSLDATMLQVDEKSYRERERVAAAKREVRATQSEHGLRTLIARGEAGDVAMTLALYQRVAECLAEEGDEDPLPVRMSKAMGWVANPARCQDLLARHAGDPDPYRHPEEQVAAHQDDETDPWADDLPPAGWQRPEHGNFYQPSFDEDEWWDTPRSDQPATDAEYVTWPEDPPIDPDDLAWYLRGQRGPFGGESEPDDHSADNQAGDHAGTGDHDVEPADSLQPATGNQVKVRWPTAFRPPGWQPLTPDQLAACAPTVNLNVHLTDHTLFDGHGVVRTDAGPILLEQLRRFLVQHDANIKVYPVLDPAATASADSWEIPLRLRRAMAIRNPRSVFPHSPRTSRMDLDHTPAYDKNGPPGQTGMHSLGPLARSEHRARTHGHWQCRQPSPGTYLWRSPEDWIMITTNQGTLDLGHTPFAHQLWESAT